MRYFKGEAWYRTAVTVPEKFKNREINLWFGGIDDKAWVWLYGREWFALKNIKTPASKTVYMMEAFSKVTYGYMKDELGTVSRQFAFRHGETTNYSCVDGHVGSLNKGHFLNFDVMPLNDAKATRRREKRSWPQSHDLSLSSSS